MKRSKFYFLDDFDSLELALKNFGITKSKIKSSGFKKKDLSKKIYAKSAVDIPINVFNRGAINPIYGGPDIEILFEDDFIIAFNKPYDIHCHPLDYLDSKNVLSYMRSTKRYKELAVRGDHYDRGLLYRLDLVTSGVLIYIKSEEHLLSLRENFFNQMREKIYIAIVHGMISNNGELENYFKPTGKKGYKQKVTDISELETVKGILNFKRINYLKESDYSIVSISLKTGIRHQIRAQLAYIGHPILGDTLYGGEESERVYLHAFRYSFICNGKLYSATAKKALLFNKFLNLNSCL